ncbi:hypothetical protein [Actinomadura sp. 9N407]|uniref:hypothetical protein n=1 Tax=Actinomadura sp. 9N407 TaxID=3375154 RepID=UPI00378A6D3F
MADRAVSERSDRVRKLREYADLGIPQYWLAEFTPRPKVHVMALDDDAAVYRSQHMVMEGALVETVLQADKPIEIRFDPRIMIEF